MKDSHAVSRRKFVGGLAAALGYASTGPNLDVFAQGRGAGRALLVELFGRLSQLGVNRLTVNTQSDNEASLGLYQKMGFVRTGEQYPVYTVEIPPLRQEDE